MTFRAACIFAALLSLAPLTFSQSQTTAESSSSPAAPGSSSHVTTTGGTVNTIPLFTTATNIQNSILTQNGISAVNAVNVAGKLTVEGNLGLAAGSSFQIGGRPFAFGSFANQNAFLGFAGNTTNSGVQNTASGVGALQADTTGFANTAYGVNALSSNTTGVDNTALGLFSLSSNTSGGSNTAVGESTLLNSTTAEANTAVGLWVLLNDTTGQNNVGVGFKTLTLNTTGGYNTAIGSQALQSNLTGGYNTALGGFANVGSIDSTNLSNATAIGAYAQVSQSNALVLGSINGVNGATASTNVGIGTATPANVFTIAQGAGHAISDGWDTYSSRRWKTNIQTLHGALARVAQLRGVSYDLKANGKHEVGVIAEEVGAVVPEVVTWEKDSKDARGVDYGRLTALLIEATKEQQGLIRKQQEQIKAQQMQIQAQRSRGDSQQAQIARLTRQVKTIQARFKADGRSGSEVRAVKAEGTSVRQ